MEALEKLSRELKKAGAWGGVLEPRDGGGSPGLVFLFQNLSSEDLDKVRHQADLIVPLSDDSLEILENLKEIAEQNRVLSELSVKDSLTSLYNYRFFVEQLNVEMERVKRTERPCSLMIVDLDHFKPVNDEHGHQTGNEVLKAVAGVLSRQARKTDIVARYGGDEFAVILPDTTASRAAGLAERIRSSINDDPGIHPYGVTASFGLAACHYLDQMDHEAFIQRADEAMYQAKREGGDRVRVHEPDRIKEKPTEVSAIEKQALYGKKD